MQIDEVATPSKMTATNFEDYVNNNIPCIGLPTNKEIFDSILTENADKHDVNTADSDDE